MYPGQAYKLNQQQQQRPPQQQYQAPPAQNPYYQQQQQMPPQGYGMPQPYQPYQQPLPPQGYQQGYPQQMPPPQQQYPQQQPPTFNQVPDNLLSNCQGNKKALLIGINYFGSRSELKGCINDVKNVKNFLVSRHGFRDDRDHMIILTDDQRDPYFVPTKQNIETAMRWLVGGARPGDSLFLHFSGHGGLVRDKDGDEASGYDSCIYPVDFERAGSIIDDNMNAMMVRHLPAGVRLTVIFDCCHSGTGLDLPYVYNSDGTLKRYNPIQNIGQSLQSVGMDFLRGGKIGAVTGLMKAAMQTVQGGGQSAQKMSEQTKSSMADVIMFSGCKDNQTSADTFIGGVGATGAMSYAFMKALNENPHQTYLSLMQHIRAILQREYSQKPQLSTARPMNMNSYFIM